MEITSGRSPESRRCRVLLTAEEVAQVAGERYGGALWIELDKGSGTVTDASIWVDAATMLKMGDDAYRYAKQELLRGTG